MKNLLSSTALLIGLLAFVGVPTKAQPTSGGGTPLPDPGVDPIQTPLDGGASLLLAGGVGYAIQHLRNRRKKA